MNEHVYKKPVELELEGVYTLMYILKKKNYGGMFIRGDEVNPTLVIKGMQFKKRNNCMFFNTSFKKAMDMICTGCGYSELRTFMRSCVDRL